VKSNASHTPSRLRIEATSVTICALLLLSTNATGEEGGSGHYLPGSIASFIDGVPATEAFITRLNMIYYNGSVSAQQPLPISGLDTAGANANSWALGVSLLWRPSWGDLGNDLSYAMSVTIPLVSMDVSADIVGIGPAGGSPAISRSSNTNGLGDVVLMPLLLNYTVSRDFNVNFRIAGYAPTGDYVVGRLANTGKNFWTVEPTLGLMYFGKSNGIEVSVFLGADFNEENPATHYRSGTQMHIDSTIAQHVPLVDGLAGAGLSVYYYKQVSPDSGSGAGFGPFEAKTSGLGPVLSYAGKVGGLDTVYELKWLHELDTTKRLEGNTVWLKAVAKFW
jgi:hypothetical protein